MDAEKLSKRDTLKRKERGRDACTHARMYARARAHEREEKEEIKGGTRGGHIRSRRQRERRKDGVREKGEGEESLV